MSAGSERLRRTTVIAMAAGSGLGGLATAGGLLYLRHHDGITAAAFVLPLAGFVAVLAIHVTRLRRDRTEGF